MEAEKKMSQMEIDNMIAREAVELAKEWFKQGKYSSMEKALDAALGHLQIEYGQKEPGEDAEVFVPDED